jgi:hypothetical protein
MNRSRDLVRIRAVYMGAIGGLGLMVVGVLVTSLMDDVPRYGVLGVALSIIGLIYFYFCMATLWRSRG